jgi:hypothetical protein
MKIGKGKKEEDKRKIVSKRIQLINAKGAKRVREE